MKTKANMMYENKIEEFNPAYSVTRVKTLETTLYQTLVTLTLTVPFDPLDPLVVLETLT